MIVETVHIKKESETIKYVYLHCVLFITKLTYYKERSFGNVFYASKLMLFRILNRTFDKVIVGRQMPTYHC